MSRDLRNSESDGSNVGDTGYEHDSWLTNQDDIVDETKEDLTGKTSSNDHKAQGLGESPPISIFLSCRRICTY